MSVPTNENGLALTAVDIGASTHRNWARSVSECSPQGPQQVQRPAQRQKRASWGGRGGLWITACARTLTAETPGKYNYYYKFYYVLIHSVVGSGFFFLFSLFLCSCSFRFFCYLVFWDLCVL